MINSDYKKDKMHGILLSEEEAAKVKQKLGIDKPYKINVLCNEGPLNGRMLQIETQVKPGEVIIFKTDVGSLTYKLMDGPAVQVAMETGEAHPNLCGNLLYVKD